MTLINTWPGRLLDIAIGSGDTACVKFLLDKGLNVNESVRGAALMPTERALHSSDWQMFNILVHSSADISTKFYYRLKDRLSCYGTLLPLAHELGLSDMVRVLESAGGSIHDRYALAQDCRHIFSLSLLLLKPIRRETQAALSLLGSGADLKCVHHFKPLSGYNAIDQALHGSVLTEMLGLWVHCFPMVRI